MSESQIRANSALIALGGNVGEVRAAFQGAIAEICRLARADLLARSSDYTTPPWPDAREPYFVNACIEIATRLEPHALLAVMNKIEQKYGRDRSNERRWGPRT